MSIEVILQAVVALDLDHPKRPAAPMYRHSQKNIIYWDIYPISDCSMASITFHFALYIRTHYTVN